MDILICIFIGLLGGFSGGLLGVGGGTVFVPLLILMRHFDTHIAIGTSLAIIVATSAVAATKHGFSGMIDWKAAVLIAVFAALGSWVGAGISLKLDVVLLRRIFAVFLLLIAVRMFFSN